MSILAGLGVLTGTAGAQSNSGGCDDADAHVGAVSRARLAAALACLIDQRRHSDGLAELQDDAHLTRAASGHAHDMLVHDFFGHRSSNGENVADRARASGYTSGARHWEVGEALHWGDSSRGTPRGALHELLNSPPHRAILMSHRLRDIGVAAVTYTRPGGRKAATYVVDMGRRD
jgi:uncharacterized protein YkwD